MGKALHRAHRKILTLLEKLHILAYQKGSPSGTRIISGEALACAS